MSGKNADTASAVAGRLPKSATAVGPGVAPCTTTKTNVVTPSIRLEYVVVLLDPDLAQHETVSHDPPASQLRPGPTRIEVSLECSESDPPYTGGGQLDAGPCTVYLDEACTQPLGGRKLTHAELAGNAPMKLYLRGTARGAFQVKLTLDPSTDARVQVKPPATEAMSVAAPELLLHEHTTPVTVSAGTCALEGYCTDLESATLIPDQTLMSTARKVNSGRLLHVQSGRSHGRARALVRLTAAEWPTAADDYVIVVESTGSDLRAYDAAKDGRKKSLPLRLKVRDLKVAEQELWIEGATASSVIRGARLSLALDRPSGGLSKSAKKHADWSRFTVVKIESVKLEYDEPAAGNPKPWEKSKHTWYINYQAGDAGRTVKIRAKLSQKIEGVKLHFTLVPDRNNLKKKNWGIDLPTNWTWGTLDDDVKHKDKVNATDLLHRSKDTDVEGVADCELVLSRFGGDQFVPAAYIAQDPHLAAYVDGHAELSRRKPRLCSHPIKVWRRFAYQKIKVKGLPAYPSTDKAEGMYGRVRARMIKRPSVYVDLATVQGWPKASILPEYMFKVRGSRTKLKLNVSDANQAQFFALVTGESEHPIKIPIITCDHNWAEERASAVVSTFHLDAKDFPRNVLTNLHVCNPPVQGGTLLNGGRWIAAEPNGTGGWTNRREAPLAASDLDIDPNRSSIKEVQVKLPAGLGGVGADTHVWIKDLTVNGALNHYLGGYDINPACPKTIVALFDPAEKADYQNTVAHEVGHAFFQTTDVPPATGVPPNPNYINDPTGGHCTYQTNRCVMFTSGPIAGSLFRYCPDCHPYLVVQDMSSIS